jgi:hypothetical protein
MIDNNDARYAHAWLKEENVWKIQQKIKSKYTNYYTYLLNTVFYIEVII